MHFIDDVYIVCMCMEYEPMRSIEKIWQGCLLTYERCAVLHSATTLHYDIKLNNGLVRSFDVKCLYVCCL